LKKASVFFAEIGCQFNVLLKLLQLLKNVKFYIMDNGELFIFTKKCEAFCH